MLQAMPSKRRAPPAPPPDDLTDPESLAPSEEEWDEEKTNPEGTPDPPPPGPVDTAAVLRRLRVVMALLLDHLPSFVVPLVLFAATALLDFASAGRAWWLLPVLGAIKGVGWALYLEQVARLVGGPVLASARLVAVPLLVLASAALAYSLGGALVWLALLAVPLLDAMLAEGVVPGVKAAAAVLTADPLTWLAAQGAGLLGVGLISIAVTALGQAMLGDLFGGLLAAVVVSPLVHVWAVLRAQWVRERE